MREVAATAQEAWGAVTATEAAVVRAAIAATGDAIAARGGGDGGDGEGDGEEEMEMGGECGRHTQWGGDEIERVN